MDKKTQISELYKQLHKKIPVFQALADEERLKILAHLLEAGSNGMNVTEIAAKSHLSRPAVSHHLKTLKDSGIIIPHKVATQIYYVLDAEKSFTELKQTIDAMEGAISDLDLAKVKENAPWLVKLVDENS